MKFGQGKLSRRKLLGGAAGVSAALGLHEVVPHKGLHHAVETAFGQDAHAAGHHVHGGGGMAEHPLHAGAVGMVDPRTNGFDPQAILRDFDEGVVVNGVRQWELVAEEKTIEVAPGVKYNAWAYNGRVPGPTLRAREGERLRVRFVNGAQHPHTIHFHGIHTSRMDGIPGLGAGNIAPGESTTYEFHATPFGLHLYHCHSMPLAEHIAKGLYGAFIIDPKQGRPEADELVMVMNGFDTNFDRANEVYAVNTVAFEYLHRPVAVKRDQLVRIYLVNTLEFDLLNSFHIHANFFDYYPTGTRLEPRDFTDTVIQGQGERGILELRFPYPGKYMFHAHVSEFAELGWMGFFEVTG
ncbi:MAG: multicopper oxidase domain-containing protein [Thermoleophilaceae bacterium]|jgi:FtsP/CotA-like multicopper oxidase with cupredoxin domain